VNNLHIITLYELHNKVASRARHVECVEPWCSTSSTQPKCMGSALRSCRVETWRAKWNFGFSPRLLTKAESGQFV